MKKAIYLIFLALVATSLQAQDLTSHDIFAESPAVQFDSVDQLTDYIKTNMSTTYRYFERLNMPSRKRVFQQIQADKNLDITKTVMDAYRHRNRS